MSLDALAPFDEAILIPAQNGCSLLDGAIQLTTDVCDRADIAKDMSDIWYELDVNEDYDKARQIYQDGKNSFKKDENGVATETKRTLQEMSTSAFEKMINEPTYGLMMHGMANQKLNYMADFLTFGDDMVMESFQDQDGYLPYYTIIAANVFPYIVHKLWDAVGNCAKGPDSMTDNIGLGAQALDEAMAFYVGAGQESGASEGDSFYMLAQVSAINYGTYGTDEQVARVNMNMMDMYEEARIYLSYTDACTEGSSTVEHLHGVVNRMIGQMNVVLMQLLIHYMAEASYEDDTENWIKLYATMIVSQTTTCKNSSYQFLYDMFIKNPYNPDMFEPVLGDLQGLYGCLGFTCEDVGTLGDYYSAVQAVQCNPVPEKLPLAGYQPMTNVNPHALIDQDILEIKQLTTLGLFTAARRIYEFGKHSIKKSGEYPPPLRTLKGMATSNNRKKVLNYFDIFKDYWGDMNYADTFVEEAFNGEGKMKTASDAQRKEIILKTIQYQTMYMYALYECQDAVDDCISGDQLNNIDAAHAWDECVAFFVGSLEGPMWPGASENDGMLHFNLGTHQGPTFGTLSSSGSTSKFNEELMELFGLGKGALERNQCKEALNIVHKIERKTLIPLIQGVLQCATKNDKIQSFDMESEHLAEGEAFAKAILPLLDFFDSRVARTVRDNMIMDGTERPVIDGPQAVADALASVLDGLNIDCNEIGSDGSTNICMNDQLVFDEMSGGEKSSIAFAFTVATIAGIISTFTL